MIPVTKTFLPPQEEYFTWVEKIYKNEWLTNRGELVKKLESELKCFLNVDWITVTNNGTIPIQIALKLLGNKGEIITTPFSYVATTSSIVWENCTPVFVDIHPEYLTIDESKIEEAITEKTTCILATHVFGNPCNIEEIERIAKKHDIKIIYDAAHCFGVTYHNKSIFEFGDISTCSFHATKLFHTAEGGAMFSKNTELQKKMFYSHNFGHNGPHDFDGVGINGKLSELHAAMGLSVLPYMEKVLEERKRVVNLYNEELTKIDLDFMLVRSGTVWNFSYYPVIFRDSECLMKVLTKLKDEDIYPRRYFYPSLNTLNYVKNDKCTISESISERVLCLPLYAGLASNEVHRIIKIIKDTIG